MSGEDKKLIEALEGYMLQPEPLCSIAKAAIQKIEDLEERIAIMEEGRTITNAIALGMSDREKVIKGLECCKKKTCDFAYPEEVCPYAEWSGDESLRYCICTEMLAKDALVLLKEQEPVKPEYGGDMEGEQISKQQYPEFGTWWYECGYCRTPIDYHDKFCRNCGKAVKWDA